MTSPKTHAYNCIAWAAGDASRWREPGIYWLGPPDDELAALASLFATLDFVPSAEAEFEQGTRRSRSTPTTVGMDPCGPTTSRRDCIRDRRLTAVNGPEYAYAPCFVRPARGAIPLVRVPFLG